MPRTTEEQSAAEAVVDSLIGNNQTQWEEGDKEILLTMNDEILSKLEPVKNKLAAITKPAPTGEAAVKEAAEKGGEAVGEQKADPAAPITENVDKPVTVESYVANAPPEVAEVLNAGLQQVVAQRTHLSAVIVANEDNAFTPEELAMMNLSQLGKLATLARKKADPISVETPVPVVNFAGAAGAVPPTGNDTAETPYVAPVMNFDK